MLQALTIRNLALIDSLELDPQAGFTALTGETGAGKSMVLDALDVALGGRAEAGLVRAGAQVCEVVATFAGDMTPPMQAVLDEQGIEAGEALVLRRQLKLDGGKLQSRAWLNGTPVAVGTLASLGEQLVDIHSQHGTMALMTPAAQRAVVDAFAGHGALVADVARTCAGWKEADGALKDARAASAKALADADLRAAWLKELQGLAYEAGEEETLLARRNRLANFAQVQQQLALADGALGDERGALASLGVAARAMTQAAQMDGGLEALAGRLESALEDLRDAAHDIARQAGGDMDEAMSLEQLDDRLHALKACARKHGVSVAEIPAVQARLEAEDALAHAGEDHVEALEQAAVKARKLFEVACGVLSASRAACLPRLHESLHAALADLLMPQARVDVVLTPLPSHDWNADGAETVMFMLAANPGQPAQALAKVASGGELSRLMLALKTVFYEALPAQTIILDEIDTGLSGAASHAVGQAMARLAARHQVVAITHHAQVAAQAAQHWRVSKSTDGTTTTSRVEVLSPQARTDELARLLSGASITEAARAAARELLAA